MFIKLGNAFFESDLIAVVRANGKKQTIIFTAGQPAVDGRFLINLPVEEVLDRIENARLNEIALRLAQAADEEGEIDYANAIVEEESADGTIEDNTITRLSDPSGPTVS